jgi:hypothetical protein
MGWDAETEAKGEELQVQRISISKVAGLNP